MFFLLQRAEPHHELRSAFTRGSIRGWIYLEATMNGKLKSLLMRTPGIIYAPHTGITPQGIKSQEWITTLTLQDQKQELTVGAWVRVCKGMYKGDIGVVESIENWGGARLLLVPRQRPPTLPGPSLPKRKRSKTPPEPALFDPVTASRVYQVDPVKQGDHVYCFRGNIFDHGLIVLPYDLHSVSTTFVRMPLSIHTLFRQSRHPLVLSSSPPCPAEWKFTEGDPVLIPSSGKRGTVSATQEASVEVDLATGEGVINVPWSDLRKDIVVGDFVEVEGGSLLGRVGWVEAVEGEVVHFIEALDMEKVCHNAYNNVVEVGSCDSTITTCANFLYRNSRCMQTL